MPPKSHGPFRCPDCGDEVILKTGKRTVNHFAHVNPLACLYAENESDEHRRCKMEIFLALQKEPHVRNVALERPLGTNRPDVSAEINGVPVAIEVQISSLSLETITQRTMEYARKGIYVLWLLQWTPALDAQRYTPRLWEKWIHAAYFGRVYYWTRRFEYRQLPFRSAFQIGPEKDVVFTEGQENDRRRIQPQVKALPDANSRQDFQSGNRFRPPES